MKKSAVKGKYLLVDFYDKRMKKLAWCNSLEALDKKATDWLIYTRAKCKLVAFDYDDKVRIGINGSIEGNMLAMNMEIIGNLI